MRLLAQQDIQITRPTHKQRDQDRRTSGFGKFQRLPTGGIGQEILETSGGYDNCLEQVNTILRRTA